MRTKTLKKAKPQPPNHDPRLESHWKYRASSDLRAPDKNSVVIVSYPDDEGVRLNNGRPGANEGPARILHYLGRMVLRDSCAPLIVLSDKFSQLRLVERHEAAENLGRSLLEKGYRVVTVGGGHDYGFPDASAFYSTFKGKILNIDAHLDVRPVIDSKLTSGTPFSRFVERFGGKALIEWGYQKHANAESQIQWAESKGVKLFSDRKPLPKITGNVGLSICLDAFKGIRAVSAPAMVGLDTSDGLEAVRTYAKKAPWMGIYECAPRYDPQNEDSARFAALLIFWYLNSL